LVQHRFRRKRDQGRQNVAEVYRVNGQTGAQAANDGKAQTVLLREAEAYTIYFVFYH
jgi:hypothetical protein